MSHPVRILQAVTRRPTTVTVSRTPLTQEKNRLGVTVWVVRCLGCHHKMAEENTDHQLAGAIWCRKCKHVVEF